MTNYKALKTIVENLNIDNHEELKGKKIEVPVCTHENFALDIKRIEEKIDKLR